MNLIPLAARLIDGPIEIDHAGNPVDQPFLDGMVSLILAAYGLRDGYHTPLARDVLAASRVSTYTEILEAERVLTCRATDCDTLAVFSMKDGPMCRDHVFWIPAPLQCICDMDERRENDWRHSPDCPLWVMGGGGLHEN